MNALFDEKRTRSGAGPLAWVLGDDRTSGGADTPAPLTELGRSVLGFCAGLAEVGVSTLAEVRSWLSSRPSTTSPDPGVVCESRWEPLASDVLATVRLHKYLWSVRGDSAEGRISDALAAEAFDVWNRLLETTHGRLSDPAACTTGDGRLIFTWDRGVHHFEVEFINDAPCEMFYRNRSTGELWGEDYRSGGSLPPGTAEKLALVSGPMVAR